MTIVKYEIINPVSSNRKPFYDFKKNILMFPTNKKYRYYVETALNSEQRGREYFILLGNDKFDVNCRLCNVDQYGRCKVNIRGELKQFIINETKHRGNIEIDYVESYDNYDVFVVY